MNNINNLFSTAISYHGSGNIAEASKLYRYILTLDPNNIAVLNNLGLIVTPDEKIEIFRRALELDPEYYDAHYNMAVTLEQQNRFNDALEHYCKIIQIVNKLFAKGDYEGGVGRLEKLIQLKPDFEEAKNTISRVYTNIGAAHQQKCRFEQAIESFSKALHHNPKNHVAHGNIIFTQNFISGMDTAQQQLERTRYNDAYASQYADVEYWRTNGKDPILTRDKLRKLRIGYISGNFNAYAATYAFAPMILNHDQEKFEVICYADQTAGDALTDLFKVNTTEWREILDLDDDQVAQLIAADKIDILVDCAGFQKGNRLLAFTRKPAPIQVTGWGEPTGTGLIAMDYLLADPVLIPQRERHLFAESIVDLPCFLGFWVEETFPEQLSLPALASGQVTFGSFNRAAKHSNETLSLWADVLNAIPGASLVMKAPDWDRPEERAVLLERFAGFGGDSERVRFLGFMNRQDHFAAFKQVDICLDPQPHSGGMTSLDALYMGVPVLTLPGATPSSRLASAVLSGLGMTEWIAADSTEFISKAVTFSDDLTKLSQLRSQLRRRMNESPIANPAAYAKVVEDQYRRMWENWCDGHPASALQ